MQSEYRLKLFIAGMNPGSIRAIENVREICDTFLKDKCDLEVIDIYQQRQVVKEMDIIVVPTLIRTFPEPQRRIIGDMLDTKKVMNVLEISTK